MNLQLGRAFSLVVQTAPYIIYRAIIYGIMALATIIYIGILALIGGIFGSGAFWVLLIVSLGASAFLGLGRLMGEYVLYVLKAGHIALITELITEGKLPAGVSQTDWAKERVMHYFKEISVLSLVDQLVKGIIGAANRVLFNVMTILPIPGLDGLAQVIQKIVDFSVTYIDEAMLAYTFKTKNENVYDATKTGIVLYAQSWKGLLKNAIALTVLSYAFTAVATLVFLIPLSIPALLVPASWTTFRLMLLLIALCLGTAAKLIVFDPIATTATILTFFAESENMQPNAEWESRLEDASDKFRELKSKAVAKWDEMQGKGEPAPAKEEVVVTGGGKTA